MKRRFWILVCVIVIAVTGSLPAFAGTFVTTFLYCTFTVNTDFVNSPTPQAFSQTSESDSGCASGTNVRTQPRVLIGSSWYYGSAVSAADNVFSVMDMSQPILDSQGSGEGRNRNPDLWSGWTSYGG